MKLMTCSLVVATGLALVGGCNPTALVGGPSAKSPAAAKPLADDGITNDVHRKHLGQIVFASHAIDHDRPDESSFASAFSADDVIYGRAYMPHSVENEPVFTQGQPTSNHERDYFFKAIVDGNPFVLEAGRVIDARRGTTTLQVYVHPVASDGLTSQQWVQAIEHLAPGDHVVRVELWSGIGSIVARQALASGQLVIHKASGAKISIGKTFADVVPDLADDALAGELLALARAYAQHEGWKDEITELKIASKDWAPVRNKLHTVIGRELRTLVHQHWPDGRCTMQELWVGQPMKLGKPDGAMWIRGVGDQLPLDCEPGLPPNHG